MIVYGDRKRSLDPKALMRDLARRLPSGAGGRGARLALLIDAGILETGVTDALSPEVDDAPPLAGLLREVTIDLAHAVLDNGAAAQRLASAAIRLRTIEAGALPEAVEVSEPEGFAFYALHPAMTALAARRHVDAVRPSRALVVGLRSIGTTLAAVVAAVLEARGVTVTSLTLRPRGHPWEREARLGPRIERALAEAAQGHVIVVDEGPGLSGSSFAAATEAASRAGVPDHRIHLMPSWDADGSSFRSPRARDRWGRHPRWTASFEEAALPALVGAWGGGPVRDIGGGLWRDLRPGDPRPAIQPQHERRKYLMERPGAAPLLLRFAGLGHRGERTLERARRHAAEGLGPAATGLAEGFLGQPWLPGRPATRTDRRLALDAIAGQVAGLARLEPTLAPPRFDELVAMTRSNAAEALAGEDPSALAGTGWMDRFRDRVLDRPAIRGDGRMMPHEWWVSEAGLLKCDGLDHHDDHFWPGAQDPAWDLAGAAVEWGLAPAERARLLDLYEARSGDRGARAVLPLNEAAYLAWRLGYTTLAAETLGDGPDGRALAALRDGYAAALPRALAGAPW